MYHIFIWLLRKMTTLIILSLFHLFHLFIFTGFFWSTVKEIKPWLWGGQCFLDFILATIPSYIANIAKHFWIVRYSIPTFSLSSQLKATDFFLAVLIIPRTPMMFLSPIQWKNFSSHLAWYPCSMWCRWPLPGHFWPWFLLLCTLRFSPTSVLIFLSLKCSLNVDVSLLLHLYLLH